MEDLSTILSTLYSVCAVITWGTAFGAMVYMDRHGEDMSEYAGPAIVSGLIWPIFWVGLITVKVLERGEKKSDA